MRCHLLLIGLLVFCLHGCSHTDSHVIPEAEPEEGIRFKGSSASARIWVLIARGQFAEAQALIAESSASGLIGKEVAERMLQRISVLSTKLVKDFTLFEIKTMLDKNDFSLATQAQLQTARKLIEEQARLMEK